jgi:hypothetical protein
MMDSQMTYVPVTVHVTVTKTMRHGLDFYASTVGCHAPKDIRKWIESEVERSFELSMEEEHDMENLCERTLEFEVEVVYRESEGEGQKAVSATCQTVCPNFVKAWVETEAMKQFNKEASSCVKTT